MMVRTTAKKRKSAGLQILDAVPCDDRLADVVADLIQRREQLTPSDGDRPSLDQDAA